MDRDLALIGLDLELASQLELFPVAAPSPGQVFLMFSSAECGVARAFVGPLHHPPGGELPTANRVRYATAVWASTDGRTLHFSEMVVYADLIEDPARALSLCSPATASKRRCMPPVSSFEHLSSPDFWGLRWQQPHPTLAGLQDRNATLLENVEFANCDIGDLQDSILRVIQRHANEGVRWVLGALDPEIQAALVSRPLLGYLQAIELVRASKTIALAHDRSKSYVGKFLADMPLGFIELASQPHGKPVRDAIVAGDSLPAALASYGIKRSVYRRFLAHYTDLPLPTNLLVGLDPVLQRVPAQCWPGQTELDAWTDFHQLAGELGDEELRIISRAWSRLPAPPVTRLISFLKQVKRLEVVLARRGQSVSRPRLLRQVIKVGALNGEIGSVVSTLEVLDSLDMLSVSATLDDRVLAGAGLGSLKGYCEGHEYNALECMAEIVSHGLGQANCLHRPAHAASYVLNHGMGGPQVLIELRKFCRRKREAVYFTMAIVKNRGVWFLAEIKAAFNEAAPGETRTAALAIIEQLNEERWQPGCGWDRYVARVEALVKDLHE